jgi:MoxR-like ATPase
VDTHLEKYMEAYIPRKNNESVFGQVSIFPNGSAMLGENIRLDPFNQDCIISVHHRGCHDVPNHEALIPEKYRPRLWDLRSLLQPDSTEASRSHITNNFSLVPLDGSRRIEFSNLQDEVSDKNYRVVGFMRHSVENAVCRFVEQGHQAFEPVNWFPLGDVYQLLTKGAVRQVRSIRGTVCLSDPQWFMKQTPIVDSERFQRSTDYMFKIFLKPKYNAVLLRGKAGVGKSCLINYLANRFMRMQVPARLQGWLVAGIGIELFMPSTHSAEEAGKSKVRSLMAGYQAIWILDEASRLVDRGNSGALDNLLLFIDLGARLVLLSDQSYLLEKREAFSRRLSPVYLRPSNPEESLEIATVLGHHQAQEAGLVLDQKAILSAVKYSHASPYAQPHAVTALLASTVAGCEVRNENKVSSESVKNEFRQMFSQGDQIAEMPQSIDAFIRQVRKHGYCGHQGFLKYFGGRLLNALHRRFQPERKGVVWCCMLVGNPGNGKTTLLEIVGRMITGSESKVMTVQCSSYRRRHAMQSLVGSPKSYIGYEEGGALQNFVKQNPDGVLILEEPELGHANVMQLLMQILEGSFTAGDGSVHPTRGLIVLISSNAGCEANKAKPGFSFMADQNRLEHVKEAWEDLLTPPIISRIGSNNIFYLPPLSAAALKNILRQDVARWSKAEGLKVKLAEALIHHVVDKENDEMLGARPVKDMFRNDIESKLSAQLSDHSRQSIEELRVFLDDDGAIQCEVKCRKSVAMTNDTHAKINSDAEKQG